MSGVGPPTTLAPHMGFWETTLGRKAKKDEKLDYLERCIRNLTKFYRVNISWDRRSAPVVQARLDLNKDPDAHEVIAAQRAKVYWEQYIKLME